MAIEKKIEEFVNQTLESMNLVTRKKYDALKEQFDVLETRHEALKNRYKSLMSRSKNSIRRRSLNILME